MAGVTLTAQAAQAALAVYANPGRSRDLGWFFKTGPGEYAEGDLFLGAKVPQVRSVATEFASLPFDQISLLAHSPIHEERLLADVDAQLAQSGISRGPQVAH